MNETLAYRQGEMFWQHKIGKCMLIYGAKIPTAANQNLTLQNVCLKVHKTTRGPPASHFKNDASDFKKEQESEKAK